MTRWAAAAVAAAALVGWAFPDHRDGPPTGHTGGFGEPLCNECHFGGPLNADEGGLTVDVPAGMDGDTSHEIHVALTHPALAAAGFQLAIRFADGDRAGEQAGTLEAAGPRTAVTVDTTGVQFAHHTTAGSRPTGDREARWTVRWTPPRRPADVVVHVATNAANDDASELGDFIYADSTRIPALDEPLDRIGAVPPGSRYRRFR